MYMYVYIYIYIIIIYLFIIIYIYTIYILYIYTIYILYIYTIYIYYIYILYIYTIYTVYIYYIYIYYIHTINKFIYIYKHLWMAVQHQVDLPQLTCGGFDLAPISLPSERSDMQSETPPASTQKTNFTLSAASANVQTFYRGQEGYANKLTYVREQFVAHGINILGLQECRTDTGASQYQDVLRLAGGCDKGCLGIEIWINLAQPFLYQGGQPQRFARGDFVVVARDPRHLLVHPKNSSIDLWLLAAHAPHSGADSAAREEWWHNLSTLISTHAPADNIIIMIDANAATGPQDGRHVFQNDDKATANTGHFRALLHDHSLCVPATLDTHEGPHGTWISPVDESLHRIDYVLIPCHWQSRCTLSMGLSNLDFGHLGDHQATALQLEWQEDSASIPRRARGRGHDRTRIRHSALTHQLQQYQPLPWHTDIER